MESADFFIDDTDDLIDITTTNSQESSKQTIISQLLQEYKTPKVTSQEFEIKRKRDLDHVHKDVIWTNTTIKTQPVEVNPDTPKVDIKTVLQKSVITPQYDKLHAVPPFQSTDKKLREQRRKEANKTKGKKWFGLPATEMTEEVERDLEVLKMRSVIDPKRFYKKNDLNVLPKYFQVGKVMDSPLDFYSGRLTQKERKRTLVDELIADAEFAKYNKRKYQEIIAEKEKTHFKAWKKAKKLKKRK